MPIARYRIDLRLMHSVRLHFRHEVMLHSLLSEALGRGELPEAVVPFACESGRVDFERCDSYRIGLTIAGDGADAIVERIARALAAYGARGFQGERIPMLRWFGVGEPERLPSPDVDAECAALAPRSELVLQFVSPLRLDIPKSSRSESDRDEAFFDARHFPPDDFLRLLWNRLFFVDEGRFPIREEIERGLPSIPPLVCDPKQLLWIDVPRMRKPPLGGVVGRLVIQNPGPAWLRFLVAGQYLHVGKSTGYGFGGYRIVTTPSLVDDPFRPARSALERVAGRERLTAAARHVAAGTEAGVPIDNAGIGPKQFSQKEDEIVTGLIRALAEGSYKPASLLGVLLPDESYQLRTVAVPALEDQLLQRATLDVLGPAINTLLDNAGAPQSKQQSGDSRKAIAADAPRRAPEPPSEESFDEVEWEPLLAKLDALFPFDPLVPLLRDWIASPILLGGDLTLRKRGLPRGAVLAPLLQAIDKRF